MDSGARPVITPRTVVGSGIAFVGLALVLDRLDLLHAERVLRYWPVGLILIGALMIVQGNGAQRTRGIFFAGIGTWLFLQMQDLLPWRFWELFWPVLLIFLGISMVMRPRSSRRFRGRPWDDPTRGTDPFGRRPDSEPPVAPSGSAPTSTNSSVTPPAAGFQPAGGGSFAGNATTASYSNTFDNSPHISMFSILSGVRRASAGNPFRGADITAFMGGARLDLRLATIPPGGEAVIDVTAVMGGVEIVVPPHWAVATPLVPFMGGIEDKRLPPLPVDGKIPLPDANTPRLVIRGFVMMAGIELKS